MILKQYYLGCLAHASYLVGDEESRMGVVIDPQRDIDQYLTDAQENHLDIKFVFLTHFHADFVAGHLELRARTGARICLGSRARAAYEFTPIRDNETLELGKLRLRILETPGHSPESISIVVYSLQADANRPYAVFTGDTLFVGDVGRPDLRASLGYSATELSSQLYDSLHQKLLTLPDDTLVYPAHGAGSLCGKSLGRETVSSIGIQRQYNYALQSMTKEEFQRLVTSEQPDAPAYFPYDAVLNTLEHLTLEQTLDLVLNSLTLDQVIDFQASGAQILDTRDPQEFASAHLAGSINIGLNGQFATWAGTLLLRDQPIIVIASAGRERESALRLGRIGFDHVAGYLEGGMGAAGMRPDLIHQIPRVAAVELAEQLYSSDPPLLIDVRTPRERSEKRIEPSLHLPLNHLTERILETDNHRRIVVHCAGGYRSLIAASLLRKHGMKDIADLLGGITAWETSGLPTVGTAGIRSQTMKPENYSERMFQLDDWQVRLTSYGLEGKYYCKVDNVEPGACIARAQGATKEEAEQGALARAQEYLSRTRRLTQKAKA